jgi:hypothetical protein
MANEQHKRDKNRPPPHRGGGDDARKQHAPSRHGTGEGEGTGHHRGAHHRQETPPETPPQTQTDWPPPERSPSEELTPEEGRD